MSALRTVSSPSVSLLPAESNPYPSNVAPMASRTRNDTWKSQKAHPESSFVKPSMAEYESNSPTKFVRWRPNNSPLFKTVLQNVVRRLYNNSEPVQGVMESIPPEIAMRRLLFSVIDDLGSKRKARLAVEVWKWWRSSPSYEPDRKLSTKMISVASKSKMATEAKAIFEDMASSNIEIDSAVCNALLNSLCRSKKLQEAMELFSKMETLGPNCRPTDITYGTLILGLGKCGRVPEAEAMFRSMQAEGIPPNLVLYNTMVQIHRDAGSVDRIDAVLKEMTVRQVSPNIVTYTMLIGAYQEKGLFARIAWIWRSLQSRSDVVLDRQLYTAVIAAFGEVGDTAGMESVLERMLQVGVQPDSVTLCAVLKGALRSDPAQFEATWQGMIGLEGRGEPLPALASLVREASRKWAQRLKPTTHMFNIALGAFGEQGNVERVRDTLAAMERHGCKMNKETFEALVGIFSQELLIEDMESSAERMQSAGYRLSRVTYNSLISGYGRAGMVGRMEAMFERMRGLRIEPDRATWAALGEAYAAAGMEEDSRFALRKAGGLDDGPPRLGK